VNFSQEMWNDANVVVVVTLIECINDNNVRGQTGVPAQLRQWFEDQLSPLVIKREADNIAMFRKGVANVSTEGWNVFCKLNGDSRAELAGAADISAAP
jgi:hypothetical protein